MPAGRPKTTGKSHNKSEKTYITATREQVPQPSTSSNNPISNYFKRPHNENKDNQKDHDEPPTAIQRVEIPDFCIEKETASTTNILAPIFRTKTTKDTPAKSSEHTPNPPQVIPDGRANSTSKYSTWENKYEWAYFSNLRNGWFCKTCEQYSTTEDAYWKTLPRKHDEHPSAFFNEHNNSLKHLTAIKNKKEVQSMLHRGSVFKQISDAATTQESAHRERNRRLIRKFFITTYFLTRKKWAVKFNFEDVIKYLSDIGDLDIQYHIKNAPKNATYISTSAVEEYLKLIGDHLNSILLEDINSSMDFTILADESTDEGDRSQLALFVRIIGNDYKPIERFLGITRVGTSKTAAAIMEIIKTFLESKDIDCSFIRFCGLDGTNSMSGERGGLQRLIRHSSPHAQYINCRNHRLALCFVHLLKEFPALTALDSMLLSVWKLFKYSSIKREVFDDTQRVYELTPLKVLKACTTRWLTHGEACWRIISRFEPLIDALDSIYAAKKCPDVKGVRDAILLPDNICMLLLVAEVLLPVNYFSKFLQTRSLNYASVKSKLQRVLERLEKIQDGLKNYDAVDSDLTHFKKITRFLTISTERMNQGRNLRDRVLLNNTDEIKDQINKFLFTTGYSFLERLIEEINKALEEASEILVAYDVFNPENKNRESNLYCEEKFLILANHYGKEIIDELNGDVKQGAPLISINEQKEEGSYFNVEFNEEFQELKKEVTEEANRKFRNHQLKREEMEGYITDNRPLAEDIYSAMCLNGCRLRYPETMKLFKFALLIPPSTANVERGFSTMNLLMSPLRTSLAEKNMDRMMRICLDGPEKLSSSTIDKLIDTFVASGRRIDV